MLYPTSPSVNLTGTPLTLTILRSLIPVRRDVQSLYHPEHDQAWDHNNPTPAGEHNQTLFRELITSGLLLTDFNIKEQADVTDTAVIIVSFGNNPVRTKAIQSVFKDSSLKISIVIFI